MLTWYAGQCRHSSPEQCNHINLHTLHCSIPVPYILDTVVIGEQLGYWEHGAGRRAHRLRSQGAGSRAQGPDRPVDIAHAKPFQAQLKYIREIEKS